MVEDSCTFYDRMGHDKKRLHCDKLLDSGSHASLRDANDEINLVVYIDSYVT